jgi:hypothetical protein
MLGLSHPEMKTPIPAGEDRRFRERCCQDERLSEAFSVGRLSVSEGFRRLSVKARPVQSCDFIFYLQFSTFQLSQLKIVCGEMLKRVGQFGFKHLVAVFEFSETRRCSHAASLLGGDQIESLTTAF